MRGEKINVSGGTREAGARFKGRLGSRYPLSNNPRSGQKGAPKGKESSKILLSASMIVGGRVIESSASGRLFSEKDTYSQCLTLESSCTRVPDDGSVNKTCVNIPGQERCPLQAVRDSNRIAVRLRRTASRSSSREVRRVVGEPSPKKGKRALPGHLGFQEGEDRSDLAFERRFFFCFFLTACTELLAADAGGVKALTCDHRVAFSCHLFGCDFEGTFFGVVFKEQPKGKTASCRSPISTQTCFS